MIYWLDSLRLPLRGEHLDVRFDEPKAQWSTVSDARFTEKWITSQALQQQLKSRGLGNLLFQECWWRDTLHYDRARGSIDKLHMCFDKCGGRLRIISFIEDAAVIEKILRHLKLWKECGHPSNIQRTVGVQVFLFELTTELAPTLLYVKEFNVSGRPGFWGFTHNQIKRIEQSRCRRYIVLLLRSAMGGYLLHAEQVLRNIRSGAFELSADGDYKVNQNPDLSDHEKFSGVDTLIACIL